MLEAARTFQHHFGSAPTRLARAPGRVELLGNHTDYNQGLVMALAVDKYITLAGAPREDARVEVVSTAYPQPARFALDRLERDPAAPWADYVKGVLAGLRERGAELRGFNAAIHSTIPPGAGLSSSAALLVATALLVRKLQPYTLDAPGRVTPLPPWPGDELPALSHAEKLALARLCQAAENHFVGVNCGLLDHLSSLFGRAGHIILLDFRDTGVDWTPLAPELAVVVCHSGVRHALVAGEYNDRRATCEAAARALGVASLRDIAPAQLETARPRLTPHQYECARHVVGENDRVRRGVALLRAGDYAGFGQLLWQSHASSRENFHNSCPELDTLVELAREHPACLGARLTGGGFGGATVNLVRRAAVEDFRARLAAGYAARTGRPLESWVCEVVDGAA
jgi:galactokinase